MVGETSVHYGVLAIAIAQTSSLSPGQVEAANFLGQMPLGTHFCIFHETTEDMFDTFVPYFRDGLENNEFCLWVVPDALRREQALKLLRKALPDFDRYLAQESIELVIHDEWFFKQGTFDLPAVIGRLGDKIAQALSRGYAGLRMNKSGSRLYKECPRQFPAYESELNALIANGRLIVLCTFSLHESGAKEVLDAARAHQITAARRNGCWEVIETAELKEAVHKIKKLQQHAFGPRFGAADCARAQGSYRDRKGGDEQGGCSNAWYQPAHNRISPRKHQGKDWCEDHCRSGANRAGRQRARLMQTLPPSCLRS